MPTLISGPPKKAPRAVSSIAGAVNPNMFSGESDALRRMGSTIERAGGQFQDVLLRRRYTDYANQYNDGQLAFQQFKSDAAVRRTEDNDFDTHAAKFDTELKQFSESYLSNVKDTRAKRELTNYFAMHGDIEELKIFSGARANLITKIDQSQPALQKINIDSTLNLAGDDDDAVERARTDIRSKYVKELDQHVTAGVMTRAKADFWMHERAKAIGLEAIRRSPETAAAVFEGGDIDVLMSSEDVKLLDQVDIEYLRNRAASQVNFAQYEQKNELEAEQAKAEEEIWDIARTGNINGVEDIVDAYPFDTDWKKKQVSEAHIVANRLSSGKSNPYTTRMDDKAYWDTFSKVRDYPDSVTEQDLRAGVGKKWTINDYKELVKLKYDEANPTKGPSATLYMNAFDAMVWPDKKEAISADGALYYDKGLKSLRDFATRKPDATPEEWSKFYTGLIEPYAADWARWPFKRNWDVLLKGLPDTAKGVSKEIAEMTDDELRAIIEGK